MLLTEPHWKNPFSSVQRSTLLCGTLKTDLTFVENWGGFFLQYLKITVHQGDPGVVILNHLPATIRQFTEQYAKLQH